MSFAERVEALWEGFKDQSKNHWPWYIVAILLEELLRDRFASRANDQLSDNTIKDVALWFVDSPFILLVVLVGVLLILSYRQKFGAGGEAGGPTSMPVWLEKVVAFDRKHLEATLQQFDVESQYGHVGFDLDNEREPAIWFQFTYVNASVYTVQLTSVEGTVLVDHKEMPGAFKFKPLRVSRNSRLVLSLIWVISTDAGVRTMKDLIAEGEEITFSLHPVKVRLEANEDPEAVPAELRFGAQQFWTPPAPQPTATLEGDDK